MKFIMRKKIEPIDVVLLALYEAMQRLEFRRRYIGEERYHAARRQYRAAADAIILRATKKAP